MLSELLSQTVAIHDSKSSLAGPPDLGFVLYLGLNCLAWALLWLRLTDSSLVDWVSPATLAFTISAGPLVLAQVMANLTNTLVGGGHFNPASSSPNASAARSVFLNRNLDLVLKVNPPRNSLSPVLPTVCHSYSQSTSSGAQLLPPPSSSSNNTSSNGKSTTDEYIV